MGHSGSSKIVEAVVLIEAVYYQLPVCASFELTLKRRDTDSAIPEVKKLALKVKFLLYCFYRKQKRWYARNETCHLKCASSFLHVYNHASIVPALYK